MARSWPAWWPRWSCSRSHGGSSMATLLVIDALVLLVLFLLWDLGDD